MDSNANISPSSEVPKDLQLNTTMNTFMNTMDLPSVGASPIGAAKAVSESESTGNEVEPTFDTFHPFPKLPAELRIEIIKETLPKWRYITVHLSCPLSPKGWKIVDGTRKTIIDTPQEWRIKTDFPPVLHVNSEFRKIALESYELRSGWLSPTKINYKKDVIELNLGGFGFPDLMSELKAFMTQIEATQVQNLVLPSTLFEWSLSTNPMLYRLRDALDVSQLTRLFPALRELWVGISLHSRHYEFQCLGSQLKNNQRVLVDIGRYKHLGSIANIWEYEAMQRAFRRHKEHSPSTLEALRAVVPARIVENDLPARLRKKPLGVVEDIEGSGLYTIQEDMLMNDYQTLE